MRTKNLFNNFFTSVGSTIEGKIPAAKRDFSSFPGDHNAKNVFLTPCDNEEILSLLAQMISSKASGPNSIPTNLLVEFRSQLVHPLVAIINMSLKEGIFPKLNKEASICPIYKKGYKETCAIYIPISLLPNLSKLFEKVMYARLEDFLKCTHAVFS